MKLYPFPRAILEKAIAQRILILSENHRQWFTARWAQKPYKKAFIETKAMPLVTIMAKGKNWSEEEFTEALSEWNAQFHEAEAYVLAPIIEGGGALQLMQKHMPAQRKSALLAYLGLAVQPENAQENPVVENPALNTQFSAA